MTTYGGGRYLIDTVKGADLGGDDGRLILDFNFAYNPSCAYDPAWACPLAPAGNTLSRPLPAGELISVPQDRRGSPVANPAAPGRLEVAAAPMVD